MDSKTFKTHIQNIEDYIFIENKIVTCLWLCQILKIHVNTAKQLLHALVREEGLKEKLAVTYILGGELKKSQGFQLKLVKAVEREETRKLFSTLTCDHVFSVQKFTETLNPTDIYNSFPNFNVSSDNRKYLPIQPSKEIGKREVKQVIVETKKEAPKPATKGTKPQEENADKNHEANNEASEPPAKQKKLSPEKKNKNKIMKGGIADLFNKQTEKKKTDLISNKPVNKKVEAKTPVGLSGFFHKQPVKKQEVNNEPMEVDNETHPIKEVNHHEEKENVAENKDNKKKDEAQKSSIKGKKSKGKENRKKRKKRDEAEEESQKKRKRITTIFSSDSESSENDTSDHEMEPEPLPVNGLPQEDDEEDIIPPTPGRKRVRKLIDKTYTDEDGFITTKKEYIYESCTDDEGAEEQKEPIKKPPVNENVKNESKTPKVEVKKIPNKKSPTKKKSPNNDKSNKQVSIMSFFKKK